MQKKGKTDTSQESQQTTQAGCEQDNSEEHQS